MCSFRRLLDIFAGLLVLVWAACAQAPGIITVPPAMPPPWTSFQAQNTPTLIFTFNRTQGATSTSFLIVAPAAGAKYSIKKDGMDCPESNPTKCSGSDVSPPISAASNFEIISSGPGEPAGTAVFEVRVEAPAAGLWQINPGTNASFTSVHVVPDVVVNYPANVGSGASSVTLNATGSHSVFEPAASAPALASVTFTQTSGPSVALSTSGPLNQIATFNAPAVTAATNLVFNVAVDNGTLSSTEAITVSVKPPAKPVDAVILTDTSGSMGWHRTGSANDLKGGCCSRLMSAKFAARAFVERLGALAGTSRVGVAIFPGEPSPSSVLAKRFTPATELASVDQFPGVINDIGKESISCGTCTVIPSPPSSAGTPTGMPVNWNGTPTSAGLGEALKMFPSGTDRSRVILLLSDGAWNNGADPTTPAVINPLTTEGVKVYTMGMGTPGADDVNHTSLQDISIATGVGTPGNPIGFTAYNLGDPATEPNLITYFEKIMSDMASLSFSSDPSSTISAGQKKTHTALVTAHDSLVSFTLSWESSRQGLLTLLVESPSGQMFQPTVSSNGYTNVTVGSDILKQSQHHGEWKLHVAYPVIELTGSSTVSYSYSVVTKSALTLSTSFNRDRYFTGSELVVEAHLIENNNRLAGGDVFMEIERPDQGLGNWQAQNPVTPGQFLQVPLVISEEPLTPLQRKNIVLFGSGKVTPPQIISVPKIRLADDGRAPDRQAGDGIYTSRFANIDVTGLYRFRVIADGKAMNGQAYHRETEVQKLVNVALTSPLLVEALSASAVEISPFMPAELQKRLQQTVPRGSERRMIGFQPRDARGNLLGPGYLQYIQFKVDDAQTLGAFDNLNGQYFLVLEYPSSAAPTFTVGLGPSLGGVVSPPVDGKTGKPVEHKGKKRIPWWGWLLIGIGVGTGIGVAIGTL